MRFLPGLIVLLGLSGCGGYVFVEHRSDEPAPRAVPAPAPHHHQITRDAAVRIALAEASDHDCAHVEVEDVEHSGKHWKVELRGSCCGCGRTDIHVKVHRRTGKVLYYKADRHERGNDRGKHGRNKRDRDNDACDVH